MNVCFEGGAEGGADSEGERLWYDLIKHLSFKDHLSQRWLRPWIAQVWDNLHTHVYDAHQKQKADYVVITLHPDFVLSFNSRFDLLDWDGEWVWKHIYVET